MFLLQVCPVIYLSLIQLSPVSSSTVIISKGGRGSLPAARRSTVDDHSAPVTSVENGELAKASKTPSGEQSAVVCVEVQVSSPLLFTQLGVGGSEVLHKVVRGLKGSSLIRKRKR